MARPPQAPAPDRERLLNALPPDGSLRTNRQVREALGLTEDRYWRARDELYDEGRIVKARGYGGRIARSVATGHINGQQQNNTDNNSAQTDIKKAADEILEEYKLYEPFSKAIQSRARDEGDNETIVEITARQGRRQTGGEWSRPDVCQVSVRRLRYLGQKVVEVTTYEIKTADCDVSAVYEALSHSRRAHRSYLAIYCPRNHVPQTERFDRIKVECARSGVGLIRFTSPDDLATFQTVIEPRANWVDLSEVDEFISTQIEGRERIRDWVS